MAGQTWSKFFNVTKGESSIELSLKYTIDGAAIMRKDRVYLYIMDYIICRFHRFFKYKKL